MSQSVKDILKRMKTGDYNCSQCGDMCDCPNTDKIIKRFAREIDTAHMSEKRELLGLSYALTKAVEHRIDCSGCCSNCSMPKCTNKYNRLLVAKARRILAKLTGGGK